MFRHRPTAGPVDDHRGCKAPTRELTSLEWLARAGETAHRVARRHPRRVGAAVLGLLAGLSASAFGIASMGPDPSLLPRRTVEQALVVAGLDRQLEALAEHRLDLMRSAQTRPSDTADSLLQRLGASDADAAAFLRADAVGRRIVEGRAGKLLRARIGESGQLLELVARFPLDGGDGPPTRFQRITVERGADGLHAKAELAPLQTQVRMAGGTIQSSLFAATDAAEIPDPIAIQMAEIFAGEIDFHRELRKGDTFSVVYEALTADGEPVDWNQGVGRVLAAEFVNDGRTHQAVWFTDAAGKAGYFDLAGNSKHKAFLASPLEFSRVSSGFAMRFHPIFQSWRRHLGVDYAAPTGTPVRTVADGVVTFAGRQNGYGNVVQIQHSKDRATVYAHLSRIDVRSGQRVAQGQRIAAVGATGWATGPHLHFEFRVDGVHQDPLRLARAAETVALDAASRPAFLARAADVRNELEIAESMIGTSAVGSE